MRQIKLWLALITGLAFNLPMQAQDDGTPTQVICVGETRPYRVDKDENAGAGTTGSTYAWSVVTAGFTGTINNNQGPSGSSNRITIAWGSTPAGTYTLQVIETNNGCPGDPVQMSIQLTPKVDPTFNLGPYCQNSVAPALPGTSDNGITGTWSPATINTSAAGSADYTFTPDAGQCANVKVVSITISPQVTPTFAAVGPYCAGASIPALPTTSTNGIDGTWTPAINNTSTTTYTFTPDPGGCASSTTLQIVITPLPTITLVGSPACSGDLLTYSVNFSVSSGTPTSSTGTPNNTGGNNWELTGIAAGTDVTISLTVATCTQTLGITAPDCSCPPVAAPSSPTGGAYCAGGTIPAISATASAGFTIDWYAAATGGTPLQSGTLSGVNTYTPAAAGTYYAVMRDLATQCVSSPRTAIVLVENALPNVTASADVSICAGETTQLSASGASSYAWSPSTGLSAVTGTPVDANPSATTTYTVTGTDSNNCQDTATVTVTVKAKPNTSAIFHD
ncbi:MAG: hypothetical protein K1X77_07530 [Bacteroidia bacterium]|nr:hypothetical protein [Bacteroidia bacterium]